MQGYPETPTDEELMPHVQEFLDNYNQPFIPSMTQAYEPSTPRIKKGKALTKPIGLKMASYLYQRQFNPITPVGNRPMSAGEVDSSGLMSEPAKGAVVTKSPEALRQALMSIGVASGRNPTGLSVDLDTARQVMIGKRLDQVGEVEEAEFRATMEQGDERLDKKKVRQFVNFDGSVTYEIMNDDKSIMSRFTIGEFKGQKVFVQGGYAAYAQILKDLLPRLQSARRKNSEFEEIRKRATGG
jgi:hypothetical protein